ncbi:SDR family oxidoreductase [Saccharibacillus qingshengii]|uniref:SDR family oxidoreductase n=1 Tax=Saccharibacillus qingshengii TaxID=1763540 RepID=UPI00155724CC|nr:SDR family oxidoreductase [Saccharibacillus qingshengii]
MRVVVTGASGFIGSAIVEELIGHGHEVIGLVRSRQAAEHLNAIGAAAIRGSVEDTKLLRMAADGADAVVHTAFFHKFSHAGLPARLRIALGGNPRKAAARFMAAAIGADRSAIETFGAALSGRQGALVIAMPTMTLGPGRLGTEDDGGDPESVGGGRVVSEKALLAQAEQGVRASLVRLPPIVYGQGDRGGLLPSLIRIARTRQASAYIDKGTNRWPAVHRLDAARLFRMAVEQGNAGARFHAIAEEGLPFAQIAEAIGQQGNLPVRSIGTDQAAAHFGWLGSFASADNPVSSALTQKRLGWTAAQPGLLDELKRGYYFTK